MMPSCRQTGANQIIHNGFKGVTLLASFFLQDPGQIIVEGQGGSHRKNIIAYRYLMSRHQARSQRAANEPLDTDGQFVDRRSEMGCRRSKMELGDGRSEIGF